MLEIQEEENRTNSNIGGFFLPVQDKFKIFFIYLKERKRVCWLTVKLQLARVKKYQKKSPIWDTLNLSTGADISTYEMI